MKTSYVILADGFEEMEAVTPVDILRRAGMAVKTVSISSSLRVTGANGVSVNADMLFDSNTLGEIEWLILPGGMPGAENLHKFAPLQGLLKRQMEHGKVAAICATPAVVLGQAGLLKGKKATCYPGMEEMMEGAYSQNSPVAVDNHGRLVTGNGPANAMLWALTIVKEELGESIATRVANGLLFYPNQRDNDIENYFG